ncbi:MAG: ribonuclease HI family protein [Deltaproteobacteria bacterium]|nr:ribonuclease HI family protein [Deltaproteobacteria bacterium]
MQRTEMWLYVDGASRGNPGHAGAGALICDHDHTPLFRLKRYLGKTTNNVAEYKALLLGLRKVVTLGVKDLHVRSDSELLVRQLAGIYKVRNEALLPLYFSALKLLQQMDHYDVVHIRREKNEEADRLANLAIDSHLQRV